MQEDMRPQEVTGNRTLEIGLGTITTLLLSVPHSLYSLALHDFYDFSETQVCTEGKAVMASAESTISQRPHVWSYIFLLVFLY